MSPLLDDDDPALFPKLTDQQLALISTVGEVRPIEVGEILFHEGELVSDPMVLLEGRVSVIGGSGGQERELVVQLPRDLMAELNLFTGQRAGATGVVREAGRRSSSRPRTSVRSSAAGSSSRRHPPGRQFLTSRQASSGSGDARQGRCR